ncbi:MAG: radical SAM protein [Thermoprotei archaeon]|nr:radical SAM protein [Thermoprotei archaeon]
MRVSGKCGLCGFQGLVSSSIQVCYSCLKSKPVESLRLAWKARAAWRSSVGFPLEPPRDGRVKCNVCVNECWIPEGSSGFCGVWFNRGGRVEPVAGRGRLAVHTYLDPHPTNCVAAHLCPAVTGRGFPEYTFTRGVEWGFYNLAVFLGGCPLDCYFCQNWEHKTMISHGRLSGWARSMDVEDLVAEALEPNVTCVCYFGGDPTPHTPLLILASRRIIEESAGKGQKYKRICWETDGLANPNIMREMGRLSLKTGGIVKIDWKAWTPSVYEALTGVSGEKAVNRLKENTKLLASMAKERIEPPLLVVSILLVPGYVTPEEVRSITEYLAGLETTTPIVLLAFHPDHLMRDLPPTSRKHAEEALKAAKESGIKEVYIGNEWLLGPYY